MPDTKYCYPETDVLINKLNITDAGQLFEAEKQLTAIRLRELQDNPITGNFDFSHLKAIHKYIFQDVYSWAGEIRTVEIGKGNLFCITSCINSYADSVFKKYYQQCQANKDDYESFIKVFSQNYADLNALHPFREGNGRAQREYARLVCLDCGYDFNLSRTTHKEMLDASITSFNTGETAKFEKIFMKTVTGIDENNAHKSEEINILTSDDLYINTSSEYDYYEYSDSKEGLPYEEYYREKISNMNSTK